MAWSFMFASQQKSPMRMSTRLLLTRRRRPLVVLVCTLTRHSKCFHPPSTTKLARGQVLVADAIASLHTLVEAEEVLRPAHTLGVVALPQRVAATAPTAALPTTMETSTVTAMAARDLSVARAARERSPWQVPTLVSTTLLKAAAESVPSLTAR